MKKRTRTRGERAAYADGLRAAARKLEAEAAWHEKHKYAPRPPAPPDWQSTCYERAYICREVSRWLVAKARVAEGAGR